MIRFGVQGSPFSTVGGYWWQWNEGSAAQTHADAEQSGCTDAFLGAKKKNNGFRHPPAPPPQKKTMARLAPCVASMLGMAGAAGQHSRPSRAAQQAQQGTPRGGKTGRDQQWHQYAWSLRNRRINLMTDSTNVFLRLVYSKQSA